MRDTERNNVVIIHDQMHVQYPTLDRPAAAHAICQPKRTSRDRNNRAIHSGRELTQDLTHRNIIQDQNSIVG
jgi:hypothetical protein